MSDVTESEVIDNIQALADELGSCPTQREYRERYKQDYRVIGRWNDAVAAAGFEPRSRGGSGIDPSDVLADIRAVAEEMGRPPSCREYDDRGTHWSRTVRDLFGSWNQAVEEAGLEPRYKSNEQINEDVGDIIRDYYRSDRSLKDVADDYEMHYTTVLGHMETRGIPAIKSGDVRRVLSGEDVTAVEGDLIKRRVRRNYGIIIEDGEYRVNPDFVLDDAIQQFLETSDLVDDDVLIG